MDQTIRNQLQRATQDARRLLESEFAAQLEGTFDILPDGTILPEPGSHLNDRQQLVRHKIVEAIEHIRLKNAGKTTAQAVDDYLREAAFTFLNRFAALKMMEARGLVQQCVTKGDQSSGFKEFIGLAPGLSSLPDKGYQLYLECLFDELGTEINVLFDRRDSASLLWPRRQALLDLLAILNREGLQGIWSEDETIGWVYQYFNSQEERKKMRDESAAPRNSRELAVRNQFFTPRYVVEFLTDNTLGRIWYEMTQGQTTLKERCRYLVRRPDEVFLSEADSDEVKAVQQWLQSGEGERPELWPLAHTVNGYVRAGEAGEESNRWVEERLPRLNSDSIAGFTTQELLDLLFLFCRKERFCEGTLDSLSAEIDLIRKAIDERVAKARRSDLSQEELLKQPVFIPHRPLKDPRDITMLDPACGSMHFGLYAFDLFEVIYDEYFSGRLPASIRQEEAATTNSPQPTDFPGLIIECNIHGIDIDPRAVQIAGLSLWLRAQKSWQVQGVKPQARPPIQRSNIVCAEPMPGEVNMLHEFAAGLQPKVLGQLVKIIFEKMKLAGETGSLLKIEEEIAGAIHAAHQDYKKFILEQKREKGYLPGMAPERQATLFDFADLPNAENFWNRAEELLVAALKCFAEQAENGGGFQRLLFAEDAARGFAFIDVCRKRYEVVVMNPPFGEAALATRPYIAATFPESKDDIYAAFVSRFAKKSAGGILGVISNRTGFFLTGMLRWRESTLLSSPGLTLMADLGDGVLDGALVEAAAYTISESSASCAFFRLLDQDDKLRPLLDSIMVTAEGRVGRSTFISSLAAFRDFPESRISYWSPQRVREIYRTCKAASGSGLEVKFGLSTKDDSRFLRLCWEVTASGIVSAQDEATSLRPWMFIAKGGEYALHFTDIHLVANWANRGHEIGARVVQLYPYLNGDPNWVLHTEVPYGKPGVTYTKRTTSGFSPRFLPKGCLISDLGCTIFADDDAKLPRVLATYASRAFGYMLEFNVASGDSVHSGSAARHYEIGTVASVPIPPISGVSAKAGDDTIAIWKRKAAAEARDETSRYFQEPCPLSVVGTWRACAAAIRAGDLINFAEILAEAAEAEDAIRSIYNFDVAARVACDAEFGPDVTSYPRNLNDADRVAFPQLWSAGMSEVVASTSQTLGFARFISKMTFIADRRLELLCHRFHAHPLTIAEAVRDLPATNEEAGEFARTSVSFALGCAFGRWDIRYATGEQAAPELHDPFAPLPVCPPGQLQNAQGLPARPEDVPAAYPVPIPWDGILVDDPNHPLDIERRVREVIEIIWNGKEGGPTAESIEHEACEILGVQSLRDYFRKPAGFFADHLKRYSKSRRQAPIYWPLSTASGSYTLWIYYHRFRRDTLSLALEDFAKPKLRHAQKQLDDLRADAGPQPTRSQRDEIEAQESLVSELSAFVEELARVAPLWNPNLNDGVIINFAPLWRMVGHTSWRKSVKAGWDALCSGEYDWAHLAMHLWPERVVPKCQTDASLAIAHGLDEVFWQKDDRDRYIKRPAPTGGWQSLLNRLVAERTSSAVKAALDSLLTAPPLTGAGGGRRGSRSATTPRRIHVASAKETSDAATPAHLRSRTSGPTTDVETLEMVKDVIAAAPDGASKTDVLTATGLSSTRWTAAINTLLQQGSVTKTGDRRGTRYHLAKGL